jgi:hypothetical protein
VGPAATTGSLSEAIGHCGAAGNLPLFLIFEIYSIASGGIAPLFVHDKEAK